MQIGDLKNFSKDLLSAALQKAGKHKDSVMDVLATETSRFFSKINVAEEARKILEGLTINFQATIRYKDGNSLKKTSHPKKMKISRQKKSSK